MRHVLSLLTLATLAACGGSEPRAKTPAGGAPVDSTVACDSTRNGTVSAPCTQPVK